MANDIIRPSALETERASPVASEFLVTDNETSVAKVTIEKAVQAGRPAASKSEAEAGSDANKVMTPLTVQQKIDFEIGKSLASKSQGDKADTAVQPSDLAAVATSNDYDDLDNKPTLGTAAAQDAGAFATAEQGEKADTALQSFATKADAEAGLGSMSEGLTVQVEADESKGGAQVFYRVEASALVEKVDMDDRMRQVGKNSYYRYPTTHGVLTDIDYLLSERATAKKLGIRADGTDQTDNLRNAFEDLEAGVIEFSEVGPLQVSEEIQLKKPIQLLASGGSFENFGTIPRGTYLKLADGASLTSSQAMLRIIYDGAFSDSRLGASVRGFGVFGNKANNTNGNGIILQGARYAAVRECVIFGCPDTGFQAVSGGAQAATQANTRLNDIYSVYNGGNGFLLATADSIGTALVAGANGQSGFNISGGKWFIGLLAWNNGVDGAFISADGVRIMMEAYDNNRSGIHVSGGVVGVNLDGSVAQRNGRDLLGVGYTTDQKSGILFSGAAVGCSARGVTTGNGTNGADAGIQSQTYGLNITSADARVDYDMPSAPTDGKIRAVKITNGGSGYTAATVAFSGGAGSGAAGTVTIVDGVVVGIVLTNGGSGYAGSPTVEISGDGTGATAVSSTGSDLNGPIKDISTLSGTRVRKITIDGGTSIGKPYSAVFSKFFSTLADGASDVVTFNSSAFGLQTSHTDYKITATVYGLPAGVTVEATLTSANTISLTRFNKSGGSVASATLNVRLSIERYV